MSQPMAEIDSDNLADFVIPEQYMWSSLLLALLFYLELAISGYGLYASLQKELRTSPGVKLLRPILIVDVVKSLIMSATHNVIYVDRGYRRLGRLGCSLFGFAAQTNFACINIALLVMTIEQYYHLIEFKAPKWRHPLLMAAGVVWSAAICGIHLLVGQARFAIAPSFVYCIADFSSRDAPDMALNWLIVITIIGSLMCLFYYLLQIYRQQAGSQQKVSQAMATFAKSYVRKSMAPANRTVLTRFVLVVILNVSFWTPYGYCVVWALIWGVVVPSEVERAAAILVVIGELTSIMTFIWGTPSLRKQFGASLLSLKSNSELATQSQGSHLRTVSQHANQTTVHLGTGPVGLDDQRKTPATKNSVVIMATGGPPDSTQ